MNILVINSGSSSIKYQLIKMPEETVGEMMVFKVYQKVSLALVLRSTKPLRLQDIVTSPAVN